MKRIIVGILAGVVILTISGVVWAGMIPAAEKAKEVAKEENSSVINEVGSHWVTPPGLEKRVYIHYKKDFAKPPWAGGGKEKKEETTCYGFLDKWAKWKKLSVSYVIDPQNSHLSEDFVSQAISAGAEEWDSWTGVELFADDYQIVEDGSWDSDIPDGRNELVFGDYPEDGVIAITVVWVYFSGPPSAREITEFDVMFDTDYEWGDATVDPRKMDLQNIATHELGHAVGLVDVYETECGEVTMYGYSDYGETKKRTLDSPDITAIQKLYGKIN